MTENYGAAVSLAYMHGCGRAAQQCATRLDSRRRTDNHDAVVAVRSVGRNKRDSIIRDATEEGES